MVFGEPVQVLVFGEITGGSSNTLTRISPPGWVRRPHSRVCEDETFFVLESRVRFAIQLACGQSLHA
jgi:hypothetical protein